MSYEAECPRCKHSSKVGSKPFICRPYNRYIVERDGMYFLANTIKGKKKEEEVVCGCTKANLYDLSYLGLNGED